MPTYMLLPQLPRTLLKHLSLPLIPDRNVFTRRWGWRRRRRNRAPVTRRWWRRRRWGRGRTARRWIGRWWRYLIRPVVRYISTPSNWTLNVCTSHIAQRHSVGGLRGICVIRSSIRRIGLSLYKAASIISSSSLSWIRSMITHRLE